MNHRTILLSLWTVVVASAVYIYIFHRGVLGRIFLELSASPPSWAYAVYLALGCLRGFTLVPATYLVMAAGMLVLPPWPRYLFTLVGIVVSSAAVYYFAEAMQCDRFFARRYGTHVDRLRELMRRREHRLGRAPSARFTSF